MLALSTWYFVSHITFHLFWSLFFMILALLCSLMCITCKIKSGCDMCLRKRFGCYRGCGQEDYWYESLDYRVPEWGWWWSRWRYVCFFLLSMLCERDTYLWVCQHNAQTLNPFLSLVPIFWFQNQRLVAGEDFKRLRDVSCPSGHFDRSDLINIYAFPTGLQNENADWRRFPLIHRTVLLWYKCCNFMIFLYF